MIKKIIQFLLLSLVLVIIGLVYLSIYGLKTNKFNQLIKEEVSKINNQIQIELEDVRILLNLKNYTIGLKINNSKLLTQNKKINLEDITTNFSIGSFIKKEFAIKNLLISTKKNSLKDIISLVRIYQNSPQLFIIDKIVKNGNIVASINLTFDEKGKITKKYNIKGKIFDANLRLLNKREINKINFNFEINDKAYLLEDAKIEFEGIKLTSKDIKINNKDKYFLVKGDISSVESDIKNEILSKYFKLSLNDLNISDIKISTNNNFSFQIDKKLKFSKIEINSKINLVKLIYKPKNLDLKKYLPKYNGTIELNDNSIEVIYDNKKTIFKSSGKFILNDTNDKLNLQVTYKDGNYNIKSEVKLINNPILIKFLNYKKKENKDSTLNIEALIKKNKNILVQNFTFVESNNKFLIDDLSLNKNLKINYINKLEVDYLNDNKIQNKASLMKKNKNYQISGKTFDGSIIIDRMLKSDKGNNNISKLFKNLNSNITLDLTKTYIDKSSYLNKIHGNIVFKNNELVDLNLKSNFPDNKKFNLTIKNDKSGEKVTTLFSGYAKPFVKKYEFIKGFEEGTLDFYSSKNNNISKSQLRIYDFKLKELPVLTKILTLASLQGIADLLSGEGIRFNELEMNFSNKKNILTIDELYAIGPAISILMNGYVEIGELVSLRGTLVPATTINKVVSSIPLLGNILVGKKTGEGVFGVSFKIKGPPKKLKTTVNPIKTLTPRFITRTLEKIKKQN